MGQREISDDEFINEGILKMIDENQFDYEDYIQKRLKEIEDLDERRFAKELLIDNLTKIFVWTEEKYAGLEQRIQNELVIPWKNFNVYTTIIEKADYDPTNSFWYPICEEDISSTARQEKNTVYLMARDGKCREFLQQGVLIGTDEETGEELHFKIEKSDRYQQNVKKLYALFSSNHIPWQTVHMGHLERFFDLVPPEGHQISASTSIKWGKWGSYIKNGMMPLWNIQRMALYSREFRIPCADRAIYEHIFDLSDGQPNDDGYLAETKDDILSIHYEGNRLLLRTEQEALGHVLIYRLCQGKNADSIGYQYPILSNEKQNNFAARYLQQTGNFIQTPMELRRKIEELSGDYKINIIDYEIVDHVAGDIVNGDMNDFTGAGVFPNDKRNILLFRIQGEREQDDYLYETQIR